MRKAYSYLRFSTPEQLHGDSFRRQTALAQEYCSKNGLTLDQDVTYNDLGVSAFRGKNAETGRLAEFLEAVKAGLVQSGSYLLVESLDRVSRQAARKALRVLESIVDEGITVVTLNDGKQYTREALDNDPMSLIMSLLVFIRANEESVMKSRRLKAAWVGKREALLKSGKRLTAKCPGWIIALPDGSFALHKERTKVVRQVYQWTSQGLGTHAITERLNADKVPTFGDGVMWHRSIILRILSSPAVIGTYVPNVIEHIDGKRVRKPLDPIPDYFPAAVDKVLYTKVQAMRSKSASPLRGKATAIHNIFGGLVRCGRCGGPMAMQQKGPRGSRAMVCTKARYGVACKYTAVHYDTLEDSFLREASRILEFTPSSSTDFEGKMAEIQAGIDKLEERYKRIREHYETFGDHASSLRMIELEKEIGEEQERRRVLSDTMEATTGQLVARRINELRKLLSVPEMDRTQTNASLRALFSGLSINPDSGTAILAWRHGGVSEFQFGFPKES
jgi:DNA invertase Pin-like site-specific DNA recombinase